MRFRVALLSGLLILAAAGAVLAQKDFQEYPGIEYEQFPRPDDWRQKAEWTRARLRYPDIYGYPFRSLIMNDGREFPGYWSFDYPRSDRHLLQGVKRLTRIDTRSVEQVVNLDGTNDVYDWPLMYAAEVGNWMLPDEQAAQLREYLLRGGFLMVDDFHGDREFAIFSAGMKRVFPNRPIVDIDDRDPIFHVLYDSLEHIQVPGAQYFESGVTYERGEDGKQPHWRGIYDDKGRIMVAVLHNMDFGDAWEHSDEARYAEKWTSLAYRMAMNYFIYDLTH